MSAPVSILPRVEDFLRERRQLGFALRKQDPILKSFARYVDRLRWQGPLTVELMADWARRDKWQRKTPATWARRLKLLRPFARYLQQFEPRTEVPDEAIFGSIPGRLTPHIYAPQEIVALLAAARGLAPRGGLRPATYEALFGLIAATGLRVSEALHLLNSDVDLALGLLTVRCTKFAKSRELPLHPSTVEALARYRDLRHRFVPVSAKMPFFVSTRGRLLGKPLGERQVHRVFDELRRRLGWINRGAHDVPRVHDLRHYSESPIIPSTASIDAALYVVTGLERRQRCSE